MQHPWVSGEVGLLLRWQLLLMMMMGHSPLTTESWAQGPNSFWPSVGTSRPKKFIVRTGKRSLLSTDAICSTRRLAYRGGGVAAQPLRAAETMRASAARDRKSRFCCRELYTRQTTASSPAALVVLRTDPGACYATSIDMLALQ
mgnify:CR=1 FL=1